MSSLRIHCSIIIAVLISTGSSTPGGSENKISSIITINKLFLSAPRIIGGQTARPRQFPHQVSIQYYNSHACGGSILNEYWILTAAHCIVPSMADGLLVKAGSSNLRNANTYEISLMISHEKYLDAESHNDIGLLRTRKPIQFNAFVQPIPLRSSAVGAGESAVTSGWGRQVIDGPAADVLQFLQFKTLSNEECRNRMPEEYRTSIYEDSLCVVQGVANRGVCDGDSGGSLIINGALVGVTAWITEYCGSVYPDVYTRVSVHVDWIERQMMRNIQFK